MRNSKEDPIIEELKTDYRAGDIPICQACKKDYPKSSMSYGYCPECEKDMAEHDLWEKLTQVVPNTKEFNGWRVGQFWFNFLEWLTNKGYAPRDNVNRLSDPFHLSDKELFKYYKEFIKN